MTKNEQLQKIEENVPKIFANGKKEGYNEGHEVGYEEGYSAGQSAGGGGDDNFWDLYQSNGNRTAYSYAFGGSGWTDTTFTPKYSMKPTSANSMFFESDITDLKGILESRGLTLDFSRCTGMTYLFNTSEITRVGIINTKGTATLDYLLTNSKQLVSVDKVILRDDGSQSFQSLTFQNCTKLTEIRFEGLIGKKVTFKDCPLSVDSMIDIIEHLKEGTGEGSVPTWNSITFSTACWNALEASGRKPMDDPEYPYSWREYIEYNKRWYPT